MALRKVNGASERSLLALLSTDFLFTILLASLLGMFFVELLKPWFLQYSMIVDTDISIYGNCIYFGIPIYRSIEHRTASVSHGTDFQRSI